MSSVNSNGACIFLPGVVSLCDSVSYLTIAGQDLIDDRHLVYSGKSLMQYIVYRLRREVFMMEKDKLDSLVAPDGKRFYPTFVWEGEDLLIDNTKTFLNQSGSRRRPKVLMGRKLVETMNWIGQDRFGNYQLSGNLIKEFPDDKVPDVHYRDWLETGGNNAWNPFWVYTNEGLQLSSYSNWRFVYLDKSCIRTWVRARSPAIRSPIC